MGYRISLHFTACCDEDTLSVRELNLRMKNDARVEYVLLDISDGKDISLTREGHLKQLFFCVD